MRRDYAIIIGIIAAGAWAWNAQAASLTFISDTVTDSQPSIAANHTVSLTLSTAIAPGGSISIRFDTGTAGFNLAGMTENDVDVASASGEYATANVPSGQTLGIVFYTTDDHMSIRLGAGNSMAAGETITVQIGTNATSFGTGVNQIENPSTTGSKVVDIETFGPGFDALDSGQAIVSIIESVTLNTVCSDPPCPTTTPTPTPTPGGGGGPSTPYPTPTPTGTPGQSITRIELWPAPFESLTFQEFEQADATEVANLLGMTETDFWAVLSAGYTPALSSGLGTVATALGMSANGLYNLLLSQYPALANLTVAQFSAMSVQSLAAFLNVSAAQLYAVMDPTMEEFADIANVSAYTLYNDLGVAEARYLVTQPAPLDSYSIGEFGAASVDSIAALLGLQNSAFLSQLISSYPALANSTLSNIAGDIGSSVSGLQNTLAQTFPQVGNLSLSQFSNLTMQQLVSYLGVTVQDIYAILSLQMQDIAAIGGMTVTTLYNVLDIVNQQYVPNPPVSYPPSSISATVVPSSGQTVLGLNGQPFAFVTDPASVTGVTGVEAGDWLFTTYAQATDTGGQTSLTAQIWILDANGQETLLFQQLITDSLSSTLTQYQTISNQPSYDIAPGDRFVLRYVTETMGGSGAPVTVTVTLGGNQTYSFVQSPPSLLQIPTPCFRIGDFVRGPREGEFECRVNIYDLSIMFYNWITPRNRPDTDLNQDGKVFTTDFSILLYWWTG